MPTTYPNIGLVAWTSGTDLFNHTQLANNFQAIDNHDHSSGKGVQIPTGGLQNLAVTGPKLAANSVDASKILDGTVGTAELAAGAVTSAKLAAGGVDLSNLASTVTTDYGYAYSMYKPIMRAQSAFQPSSAAGTYYLPVIGTTLKASTSVGLSDSVFYFNAADYTAGSRSLKGRLRIIALTNTLTPGTDRTFTASIVPVTAWTTPAGFEPKASTFGTAPGTVSVTVPFNTAGQMWSFSSADFDLTGSGIFYAVRIASSAALGANEVITTVVDLHIRHV